MYEQQYETADVATDYPMPASVVENLNDELQRLDKLIAEATSRLVKVLSPEYDGPEKTASVPEPIVSPIRATLRNLAAANDRLASLITRVEA